MDAPACSRFGFSPRLHRWGPVLLLGILALGVFVRALTCDFINYDDNWFVSGNEIVLSGLSWENLNYAFSTREMGYPKPVTILSWMLDAELYGKNPAGYHFTNVLLHVFNTLFLYFALRAATGSTWRSLLVAALWAVHPLRVESVVWIAQRKDLLSAFFGFLSIWAYVAYARDRRFILLLGSSLLLMLSLMSKPTFVTMAGLLLLLDIWPLGRTSVAGADGTPGRREPLGRLLLEKVPFLLLSLAGAAWVLYIRKEQGGGTDYAWAYRLGNAGVSYVRYLAKMVWFHDLALVYPRRIWSTGEVALCYAMLLVIAGLVLALARRHPRVAVGWLWFVGAMVPMTGVVPFGNFALGDRFTYIPSIGLFMALGWSLPAAWVWGGGAVRRRVALGAMAAAVAGCSAVSVWQIGFWQNSGKLFARTLEVTGPNPIAFTNIAGYHAAEGNSALSVAMRRKRVEMGADARSVRALAAARFRLGDWGRAIAELEVLLKRKPEEVKARGLLARILAHAGRYEQAMTHYGEALGREPGSVVLLAGMGRTLGKAGEHRRAMWVLRRALEIAPDRSAIHNDLGTAYDRLGRRRLAGFHYHRAAALDPQDRESRVNLGLVLMRMGAPERARRPLEAARELGERSSRLYRALAQCYADLGELKQAAEAWQIVLERDPGNVKAHNELGVVYARAGLLDRAIAHFRDAVRLDADYEAARRNLKRALDLKAERRS